MAPIVEGIRMKLGISHGPYVPFGSFEEQIRKIKEHGYDCVDYQRFITTDNNPWFEELSTAEFLRAVKADRAVLDEYGIIPSQAHGPWRYPPRDATDAEQQARLVQMCRAVEGTAALGCKNFVLHPFMPNTTDDRGKERETLEVNLRMVRAICDAAKQVGVTVCLENMPMPQFSIGSVRQILECVEAVGADNLKCCLDTGHVTMFGTAPADAVRMIGRDRLAVLHIHDNDGERDWHMLPFRGIIDWDDFCKALAEIGFAGTLSLECGPANVPEGHLDSELLALHGIAQRLAGMTQKHAEALQK